MTSSKANSEPTESTVRFTLRDSTGTTWALTGLAERAVLRRASAGAAGGAPEDGQAGQRGQAAGQGQDRPGEGDPLWP